MKRIISGLLVCILAVSMLWVMPSQAAGAVELTVENKVAKQGENVSIAVKVTSNSGFAFLMVTPVYDSDKLTLVSTSNGNVCPNMTDGKNPNWYGNGNNIYTTGTLMTFNFRVQDDAIPNAYNVDLIVRECYNSSGKAVSVTTSAGAVCIECQNHSYAPWERKDSRTHSRTCSVCKHTEEGIHTWNQGEVTKPASCKQDGEIEYICTLCNATRTERIARIVFPDVSEGVWFFEAVNNAVERGIFGGYSNGNFGPADNIQRQDFLVVLARLDGVDLSAYASKDPRFSDVAQGAYFYAAVAWGAENGIVTGYNDGRFGTGDCITREQILTFFYRYAKYKGLDVSVSDGAQAKYASTYSDFSGVSTFAQDAVVWALEKGAISGKTPTTVVPLGTASRAEAAQIFYNVEKKNIL